VADTAERLWRVIEPYVAAEGVELDDVVVRGGGGARLVRVIVDADEALDVEHIADLSRGIGHLLDQEDLISGSYTLEVGSPGLERELTRPRHFEKSVGREVKVKTLEPVEGERLHRGTLVAADGRGIVVDVAGQERKIGYEDVASARTVFVWERAGKPGKKQEK